VLIASLGVVLLLFVTFIVASHVRWSIRRRRYRRLEAEASASRPSPTIVANYLCPHCGQTTMTLYSNGASHMWQHQPRDHHPQQPLHLKGTNMGHVNDSDLTRIIDEWRRAHSGEIIGDENVEYLKRDLGIQKALEFGTELSAVQTGWLRSGSSVVDKDGDVWTRLNGEWYRATYLANSGSSLRSEGVMTKLGATWQPYRFISGGWQ
jgi:hypothetical protein